MTPELCAFRAEVRAFLGRDDIRESIARAGRAGSDEDSHPWEVFRGLGARRWLAPDWPVGYGGLDHSRAASAVVVEELVLHGVSDTVYVNTIDNAGTCLLRAGTGQQKQRYLPGLAAGTTVVSVLFSEPTAGSDLSALRTRAERVGDGWRLSGRKVWNARTSIAAYGLCAARVREGPTPYAGITLFLVPLDRPGVTVRRLAGLNPESLYEVVLDDVPVTDDETVGPPGGGWSVLTEALRMERTGIGYHARARRWLDGIAGLAGAGHADRIAALDAEVHAGRALAWRVVDALATGAPDDVSAAMSKWYNSEVAARVARLGVEVAGPAATLSTADGAAPLDGMLEAAYREAPGLTLAAGTSEMMLHIIAADLLRPLRPEAA